MTKSKTIYVVTSGEYSDYGINALFSTPEMAQTYVDRHKGAGIEEWALDDPGVIAAIKKNYHRFTVHIQKDGTIRVLTDQGLAHSEEKVDNPLYPLYFGGYEIFDEEKLEYRVVQVLFLSFTAKDQTTAVKIANDFRRKLIAEDRWISDDVYEAQNRGMIESVRQKNLQMTNKHNKLNK